MDYEKEYKEALKRAKAAIDIAADKDLVRGVAITIFPQLNESEDERIRKGLIELIENWNYPQELFTTKRNIIGYLEKQKEQREATPETYLKGIFDFDDISQLELAVDCYKEKKGRAYPVTVKHQHEVLMKLYDLIGIDREALDQDEEDETD